MSCQSAIPSLCTVALPTSPILLLFYIQKSNIYLLTLLLFYIQKCNRKHWDRKNLQTVKTRTFKPFNLQTFKTQTCNRLTVTSNLQNSTLRGRTDKSAIPSKPSHRDASFAHNQIFCFSLLNCCVVVCLSMSIYTRTDPPQDCGGV